MKEEQDKKQEKYLTGSLYLFVLKLPVLVAAAALAWMCGSGLCRSKACVDTPTAVCRSCFVEHTPSGYLSPNAAEATPS